MTMTFWLHWLAAFFLVLLVLSAGVIIFEYWPWKK